MAVAETKPAPQQRPQLTEQQKAQMAERHFDRRYGDLKLSKSQQAKIKAIEEQYRPQARPQISDAERQAFASNADKMRQARLNVIQGKTFNEAEAQQVLAEIIDHADPDAVRAFGHEVKQAGAASPEGEGNWAKSTFEDLVQYNDGFKTNLIGTPQQIAERIVALKAVGVDLILSGFLHFQEDVAYFGEKVLPLVRELEARQAAPAREAVPA